MASFSIQTFGCQMNVRDSQWLAAALEARGLDNVTWEKADVVILNTCSVREKPEQKVIQAIRRVSQGPVCLIAVAGCVAQQLGQKLFEITSKLRLVAGADGLVKLPDAILHLLAHPAEKLAFLDFESCFPEREQVWEKRATASAYVNIMQGCDNFCSYCIVPFTRGRQKSRGKEAILAECQMHLANGAKEITLLGQNVNAWGADGHDGGKAFASLLKAVARLPELLRLRFVTPHPADLSMAVVACFGELPNLCPRLHLPLQAGSDRILKLMRRRHGRNDYLKLVKDLRTARPDLALSTDLIVGFPGESEEDFQQTLDMLVECNFMSSYSFCYSDRPGTRASLMPDKVAAPVQLDRLKRLQALQDELTANWLAQRLGATVEILLEAPSPRGGANSWQGRDVYGACVNATISHALAGDLCPVTINGVKKHSLTAIASPDAVYDCAQ